MNKLLKTIYKSGLMRLSFAIGLLVFSMGSVQAQSDADLSAVFELPTERLMDEGAARQVIETKMVELKEQVVAQNLDVGTPAFRNFEMQISMYDGISNSLVTYDKDGNLSYNSLYKAIVYSLQQINDAFDGGVTLQELEALRADAINTLKQ